MTLHFIFLSIIASAAVGYTYSPVFAQLSAGKQQGFEYVVVIGNVVEQKLDKFIVIHG